MAQPGGITHICPSRRESEGGSGIQRVTVERVGLEQHRTANPCELPRCPNRTEYRYELPSGASEFLCRSHFGALLGLAVIDGLELPRELPLTA